MEIISAGHTNFLVKVELPYVPNPMPSPKSSRRLPPNTLNIHLRAKIVQHKIINHTNFLEKKN